MEKYELDEKSLDELKNKLLELPRAKMSISGNEIAFRCPFCGDSKSDPFATSFSVNVNPASEKFGNYQCFRAGCMAHGIIDNDFLYMIGFDKIEAEKNINKFIKTRNVKIDGKFKLRSKRELYNVINSLSDVSEAKRQYINKRLGLKLSYKDLYNFKINLSLIDLLKINEIPIAKSDEYYYKKLSDYGVSFISAYNDYVIIRDISKSNKLKKRYTNIAIFKNKEAITKAYCIPSKLDLLSPEPTVINISEGAFDILGVYHHMKIDRKYENKLYLAACGSGIINTLIQYIQQYALINCKINIFSDADVPIEKYKRLEKLKPYLIKPDITIYYNTLNKDFGVSKDKIKAIKSKL